MLFFIDAIGLRPQIAQMADRIAAWGYTVLAPNTLYRSGTAAETSPTGDLRAPGAREEFFAARRPADRGADPGRAIERDIPAYLAALREHGDGDEVAVVGYCMGARLAVRAANLDPDVVAVAGFHGGGLVTDDPRQPARGPAERPRRVRLRPRRPGPLDATRGGGGAGQALADAGLTATNEIYPGSPHGYSMNDTSMYHEPGAERSFDELHALLGRTLGA